MAFPTSPSNGDIYDKYIYDNTLGAWKIGGKVIMSGQMGTAQTNPTGPINLKFNEFWNNEGGIIHDTNTGRFTIPFSGIYRITFNPFFRYNEPAGRVLIGVNIDSTANQSNHFGHTYRGSSDYETGCINSVIELAAGDWVVFRLHSGSLYNQSTDKFNQFTIEKIN